MVLAPSKDRAATTTGGRVIVPRVLGPVFAAKSGLVFSRGLGRAGVNGPKRGVQVNDNALPFHSGWPLGQQDREENGEKVNEFD